MINYELQIINYCTQKQYKRASRSLPFRFVTHSPKTQNRPLSSSNFQHPCQDTEPSPVFLLYQSSTEDREPSLKMHPLLLR